MVKFKINGFFTFFRRITNYQFEVLSLITLWALAVSSRFFMNGRSYELDFSVFQPDGVLYALRTYMFMGWDPGRAAKLIETWYYFHGSSGTHFDPNSILPENTPAWGLVAPRLLYPLLSMPFVQLLGMNGLLVVPTLSLLVLVLAIHRIGRFAGNSRFAAVIASLLLISPTVLRWMISNITDSLFAALFALVCLVLIGTGKDNHSLIYLSILIVLTNLTRFATPIWLGLCVVEFLKGRRRRAIYLCALSLIATIPTFLTQPSNSVLPRSGNLSVLEKLTNLPLSFFKILFFEVAQLAVMDRLLLTILAVGCIMAILNLKSEVALRFLLVLLATWSIGALNGSIGVNFRYQLPVLPFACAVIIMNFENLRNWLFRSVRNI